MMKMTKKMRRAKHEVATACRKAVTYGRPRLVTSIDKPRFGPTATDNSIFVEQPHGSGGGGSIYQLATHTHTHTGGRAPQSPIPSPSTHCRSQQVAEYGHCPSTRLAVVERTRTNQHRSNRIRRWPSINYRSPAWLRYNALLYIAPTFCRFIAMPVNIDVYMQPPCSQAVSDSRSTNTY